MRGDLQSTDARDPAGCSDRGERFVRSVPRARRVGGRDGSRLAPRAFPGGDQGLLDQREDAQRPAGGHDRARAALPAGPPRRRRRAPRSRWGCINGSSKTSSYPNRTDGKVFFTLGPPDAGDYACSGTAVRSPSRSLVWTAGHCVYDAGVLGAGYATNWEFVPGYQAKGASPSASGRRRAWPRPGNGRAPASSTAGTRPSISAPQRSLTHGGKLLQDRVGARRIAFNQPRSQVYTAFGYPAERPPPSSTAGTCSDAGPRIAAPTAASARRRRSGSPAT